MEIRSAWNGLYNLNTNGAKMIQSKGNPKGQLHPQAGFLRASPVLNERQNSQKSADNEVSLKACGKEQPALGEYRMRLEQDVRQLRERLSREVSIHKVLQRAFDRPIGYLPRLPIYLPPKTQELLAEVAVLEEEVVQLEDHVFSLQQDLQVESYNNASFMRQLHQSSVFPASWTKSPPQKEQSSPVKKDVVVAKLLSSAALPSPTRSRELHYDSQIRAPGGTAINNRNLNKQSPTSSSPRFLGKDPSASPKVHVTSSPHCSRDASSAGRVSPVRQVDCGKQNQHQSIGSYSSHWPQTLKAKTKITKLSMVALPPTQKVKHAGMPSDPKSCVILNFDGASELCNKPEPNKLSEEMMKCLLSIYCMMTRPHLMSESDSCSSITRSAFSSFNSQSNASKSTVSTKMGSEISFKSEGADPYSVCGEFPRDIGPYKNFQYITAKSFDYRRIQDSASMLRRLRVMVDNLGMIDLRGMSHQQKLAFWINIYNVCMMHGFLEYGIPGSPHQVMALMQKAVLNVGGYLVNALAIEHFILRSPSHSKHQAFGNIRSKENVSIQAALALEWPEPLVSFALCCGSQSSPAVRVYTATKIENELEVAKKEYLQAAIGITKRNKVLIPKLLDWSLCHFAKDTESFVDWICKQIPLPLQKVIQECVLKAKGVLSKALEVMPYNFNFRYLLVSL